MEPLTSLCVILAGAALISALFQFSYVRCQSERWQNPETIITA